MAKKKPFEVVNVTLSVQSAARRKLDKWTKVGLERALFSQLDEFAAELFGLHGRRWNVEVGPRTIVEEVGTDWKIVDIEPASAQRARERRNVPKS